MSPVRIKVNKNNDISTSFIVNVFQQIPSSADNLDYKLHYGIEFYLRMKSTCIRVHRIYFISKKGEENLIANFRGPVRNELNGSNARVRSSYI